VPKRWAAEAIAGELDDKARTAGLLGSVLSDLGPLEYRPADARYQRLLDDVMQIFDKRRSPSVPVQTRIAAADALGQAGDPRIDPRRRDYWVTIPAGTFLMGAQSQEPGKPNYDEEARKDESPVHEVRLEQFQIARYPVTVGQYGQFVGQEGYHDERWWQSGGFGRFSEPGGWEEQLRYPSRPVTKVSWFEAAAYSAWARCRLPTEAEWERAARGKTGRKFPWGDEPADASRVNFENRVRHETPVGIYPLGNTPEGICDLAGNVWEWCWDWSGKYSQTTVKNARGPDTGNFRVLRGGAWGDSAWSCRAAVRYSYFPVNRDSRVGFRVVVLRQNSP
jgi:formylglycine-generating enzyme required for sulfatase activity